MFNFRENPFSNHPERKSVVRTRLICGIGGAMTALASVMLIPQLEPLSAEREYLIFSTLIGAAFAGSALAAELQERYGKNDGGDGWWRGEGWGPDPIVPPNPGGLSISDEAEAYLKSLLETITV